MAKKSKASKKKINNRQKQKQKQSINININSNNKKSGVPKQAPLKPQIPQYIPSGGHTTTVVGGTGRGSEMLPQQQSQTSDIGNLLKTLMKGNDNISGIDNLHRRLNTLESTISSQSSVNSNDRPMSYDNYSAYGSGTQQSAPSQQNNYYQRSDNENNFVDPVNDDISMVTEEEESQPILTRIPFQQENINLPQIEAPTFADYGIQTEAPTFADFGTQTEAPTFADYGIQTEAPTFADYGIQTEPDNLNEQLDDMTERYNFMNDLHDEAQQQIADQRKIIMSQSKVSKSETQPLIDINAMEQMERAFNEMYDKNDRYTEILRKMIEDVKTGSNNQPDIKKLIKAELQKLGTKKKPDAFTEDSIEQLKELQNFSFSNNPKLNEETKEQKLTTFVPQINKLSIDVQNPKEKLGKNDYFAPYEEPNTEAFNNQLKEVRDKFAEEQEQIKENESKIENIQKIYNDAIVQMNIATNDYKDREQKSKAIKMMNIVLKELGLPRYNSGNTSTLINKFTNDNTKEKLNEYIQKHGQKDLIIDKPYVIGKKSIIKTIYDKPDETKLGSPMTKRATV